MASIRAAGALEYKDIRVGRVFSFKRHISKKDVADFARLTGDYNPLHLDDTFGRDAGFKGPIIHGMLAASLFSTLAGMYCPGRYSLIISQEIKYMKPVRPGSDVIVRGKVVGKIDAVKVLVVANSICGKDGKVLVNGITKIKVMR